MFELSSVSAKGRLLQLAVALTAMLVLFFIWPCGQDPAGAAAEDGHMAGDGYWLLLPDTPPKGREILLNITHEFVISPWRNTDGSWKEEVSGKIIDADKNLTDEDVLIQALEREWEFNMALPDEVADKINEGYTVGVSAKAAWGLQTDMLFYLERGPLQYRLEDDRLYINCYPRAQMHQDVYYHKIIDRFDKAIPLVEPRYGTNPHGIYDLDGKPLGSTSTFINDADLFKKGQNLSYQQQKEIQKELEECAEKKWIHFSQIQDANGYLTGHQDGKRPFEIGIWKDDNVIYRNSGEVRIGSGGSFEEGADIGLWFWYPLELTFFLENMEDVAVVSIDCGDLEPFGTATVFVTVANYGVTEHDPQLKVTIPGIKESVTTVTGLKQKGDPDGRDVKTVEFWFTAPKSGLLSITAEINPNRAFEEINYDNNILTLENLVVALENIPPWILTKDLYFSLGSSVSISAARSVTWDGNATGGLIVENVSGPPDIYNNFEVKNNPAVNAPQNSFIRNPQITATLDRADFGDDPKGGYFGDNLVPLSESGRITGYGSASRDYHYTVTTRYSDGTREKDRITGTAIGHFGAIDDERSYAFDVYNGLEELPYQKPLNYEKPFDSGAMNIFAEKHKKRRLPGGKDSEDKFDLFWKGENYDFNVVRWMCHLDENDEEYGWESVPGQYIRAFTGQSSATLTWETVKTMEELYGPDKAAVKANYTHAVFATDKLLREKYDWPIKSGYYFNPVGEYKCTVYTAQYKNSESKTEEHAELVDKVKKAFCYDSALLYVRKDMEPSRLGEIKWGTDGNGLLVIDAGPTDKDTAWLATTAAREEDAVLEVSGLYKEAMEGYGESRTEESYRKYRYMERTDDSVSGQDIYLVEETTVISFKVEVPAGKLYTHVNMKNGEYTVRARVKPMELAFDHRGSNGALTMEGFNLDALKVTVSGSMYDDR